MINEKNIANDYPEAKALNLAVMGIIIMVVMAEAVGMQDDSEIHDLNRAYVLLTNELQKLYDRNPELSAIKPEPIWKRFDVLKTSTWEIANVYMEDEENDLGHAHIARIDRLCIISGNETPDLSPEQKKIIEYAETVRTKYGKMLDKINAENRAKKENNWQIPEYTLTFKFDGSILVNNVLKLKKVHASSTTERLLDQAIKNPNILFKPDIGQTSRNLSTVISGAGFTEVLRALFFPTASNSRGIFFRPIVTRQQADEDSIDTTELDLKLKELGADTEPKST